MIHRECQLPRRRFAYTLLLAIAAAVFISGCNSTASFLTKGEEYLQKRKFHDALMQFRSAAESDNTSAAAHWGLARASEKLGLFNETVEELRKTVDLDASNLEAKAKLGSYFLLVQPPMIAEAESLRDQILSKEGNYIEGHLLTASILAAQSRPDAEILNVVDRAISIDPKRIETYISLERFFMTRERADEAEKAIKRGLEQTPDSVPGLLEYGRFLMYSNRDNEAEVQFDRAIGVSPNDIEAREAVAEFYMLSNQLEKAERAYLQLVELQENSPESRLVLAEFYKRSGRVELAITTLGQILEATPAYARARYELIKIHADRREIAEAEEHLANLFKVNDEDLEALLSRARIRLLENRADDAVADLEDVLKKQPSGREPLFMMAQAKLAAGHPDQANAFLADLERYHPTFIKAGLLKVQAAFNAGDAKTALKLSSDLIDRSGAAIANADLTPEIIQDVRIRAISSRGLANLELGDLAASRRDLEEVVKVSARSASARVNLARLCLAESNNACALENFEKALGIDQNNFDAISGFANAAVRSGQAGRAHQRLSAAIDANAGRGQVIAALRYLNAGVFTAEKKTAEAERELQEALAADPDYLPAYSAYAGLLAGSNKGDEAVRQYRTVVEKRPAPSAFTMLGILEDSRGNSSEAEKAYRKALEMNPEATIAANNLAWLLAERQGNLDEALQLATMAVNKSQSTAGFYDTLGWVYLKKGLYSPAVEQMKRAVALEESNAKKNGTSPDATYRARLEMAMAKAANRTTAIVENRVSNRS